MTHTATVLSVRNQSRSTFRSVAVYQVIGSHSTDTRYNSEQLSQTCCKLKEKEALFSLLSYSDILFQTLNLVISLVQSKSLKPYIEFNIPQRQHASNDFEKDFVKLINNSVCSQTMENLSKHKSVELVENKFRFKRLTSNTNFKSFKMFSEKLVAINEARTDVCLIKPTYVTMSILDLSKTFMFAFHYDKMVTKYGEHVKLLMTDTYSSVLY